MLAHGPQVFHVQQQHAPVIGNLEHQLKHTGLGVIEVEHARQQQGPQVADRGPHRVTLFAEHIPQRGGEGLGNGLGHAPLGQHLGQLLANLAGLGNPGQVTLDVGHEHGHADAGKLLGKGLQGDGFAGAGGSGDQTVAVGFVGVQRTLGGGIAGDEHGFNHENLGVGSSKMGQKYNLGLFLAGLCRLTGWSPAAAASAYLKFKRVFHGRSFQMGQHSAPQRSPG